MERVIARLVRRVEAALGYRPGKGPLYKAHPAYKIAGLAAAWASILLASRPCEVLTASAYPLLLHVLAGRRARYAVAASSYPALVIAGAALLLSPHEPLTWEWAWRSLLLGSRVYLLSSATLISFMTSRPTSIASLLARRAPMLHDTVLLSYRLTPQTVQDLATALEAQSLIGKGAREALTGTVLNVLARARMAEASFYSRGAQPGKPRTPVEEPRGTLEGLALLTASLAFLVVLLFILH